MTTAPEPAGAKARPAESFAALRHRGFRAYFVTYALAMTADNSFVCYVNGRKVGEVVFVVREVEEA